MLSTFFCLHDISWKNGEIAFFYSLSFKNGVASLHSLEGFKGEERTEKCFPHMFYQWLLSPGIWLTHTQCVKAQGIMGLGFLYNTVDISVYIKKFLTSRSFWFPNGLVLKPLKGKWLSLKDGCVFVWSVDATGTEEEARRSSPPPGASLVVQMVKNLPTVRETWVQSLGREDSPREGNGYPLQYSAWRISWMEEPGGLQSTGSQRVGHDWATKRQMTTSDFLPPSGPSVGHDWATKRQMTTSDFLPPSGPCWLPEGEGYREWSRSLGEEVVCGELTDPRQGRLDPGPEWTHNYPKMTWRLWEGSWYLSLLRSRICSCQNKL